MHVSNKFICLSIIDFYSICANYSLYRVHDAEKRYETLRMSSIRENKSKSLIKAISPLIVQNKICFGGHIL